MSKGLDIDIYSNISSILDVSEIYFGHIQTPFNFTKAQYTATFTEAYPLNPFDKVICELLKIEGQLSFEDIGDILGMNVYESENPKRYVDLAEKEILTEALQSLASSEFGNMIEGGDIFFSSCRLTQIGKEYAEKQNKYKKTSNKPFEVFFDQTTGNHKLAKMHFEFVDGFRTKNGFACDLVEEVMLKEIAETQIPEIYNPVKQFSFTNAILNQQINYTIDLPVAITYNLATKMYGYYCYDSINKRIHEYFTKWVNENIALKEELLQEFISKNVNDRIISNDIALKYLKQNSDFESHTKINSELENLVNKEFIDEYLFLSSFNHLFKPEDGGQLYICLPTIEEPSYKVISKLIQQSENNEFRLFLVLPTELIEPIERSFNHLKTISEDILNLYTMQQQVKSFLIMYKSKTHRFYWESRTALINNLPKTFIQRMNWDEKAEKFERHFIEKFSEEYGLKLCEDVNEVINSDLPEAASTEQIDELNFYKTKLEPFATHGKHAKTVTMTLELIETFKRTRVEMLLENVNNSLDEIQNRLTINSDEKELLEISKSLSSINLDFIESDPDVSLRLTSLKEIISIKKEEFQEAKRIYWFIIDTNTFIEDADVISKILPKNKIVIAAKVLDELDKHKSNPILKETASKAIREIFADRNRNIHRAKANLKLLPPDFSRKSSDNLILAVALMYKDKSGILISSDKGLHEKAKVVEMPVLSYTEFIDKFVNIKK